MFSDSFYYFNKFYINFYKIDISIFLLLFMISLSISHLCSFFPLGSPIQPVAPPISNIGYILNKAALER